MTHDTIKSGIALAKCFPQGSRSFFRNLGLSEADIDAIMPVKVVRVPTLPQDAVSPPKGSGIPPNPSNRLTIEFWRQCGVPEPVCEYRFHPVRRWRLDYAWPAQKVGLENDGGVWVNGGHNRGSGYVQDTVKRNELACLGWRVLRCQPRDLRTQETAQLVKRCLGI